MFKPSHVKGVHIKIRNGYNFVRSISKVQQVWLEKATNEVKKTFLEFWKEQKILSNEKSLNIREVLIKRHW